ncbi:kinetochore protein NNF1 [Microdochium nivale]|nr:kinetochore protein NNF1 [Microdochium nivale]
MATTEDAHMSSADPVAAASAITTTTAAAAATRRASSQRRSVSKEASIPPPQQHNQNSELSAPPPPASPPLPTRHVQVTPGPRAAGFQNLLDKSLESTLKKVSWDNFAACYPTIAAQAPATLKAVQKQMVDRLGALCRREFQSIFEQRQVVAKMNELESLISEASRRKDEASMQGIGEAPVPPHTLPAEQVFAAHLAPHLKQQQSQLNAKLQTTQAHNARLFDEVQQQRAEMESLVQLLEKTLEDIDSASQMMDEVAGDLARETRTVEVEMADR